MLSGHGTCIARCCKRRFDSGLCKGANRFIIVENVTTIWSKAGRIGSGSPIHFQDSEHHWLHQRHSTATCHAATPQSTAPMSRQCWQTRLIEDNASRSAWLPLFLAAFSICTRRREIGTMIMSEVGLRGAARPAGSGGVMSITSADTPTQSLGRHGPVQNSGQRTRISSPVQRHEVLRREVLKLAAVAVGLAVGLANSDGESWPGSSGEQTSPQSSVA